MPKSLRTLDDHVQNTLESRSRTQAGRFQPMEPGTERVADVVACSCAAVAEAFANDGFKWSKSALRFSRKVGAFTHIVSFQSDSANTSGSHVGVSIHAQVKSSVLAEWRETAGVTTGDNIWSTQIGYLSLAHDYLKWQLVDPVMRQVEVASMVNAVRAFVMPAFAVCSTKEGLSAQLLERREITWTPDWAIDVALWVDNKAAAQALIDSYLASHSDLTKTFIDYSLFEATNPSASRPADPIHCLAWVASRHGLRVPSAT